MKQEAGPTLVLDQKRVPRQKSLQQKVVLGRCWGGFEVMLGVGVVLGCGGGGGDACTRQLQEL